jgi:hypothetical protein
VLPPELRESEQFRTRAERGVFVTIGDLAQLTYSPRVFAEARRRAELAGVRIVQGEPDAAGYDRLATDGLTALQRAGATHVVLRRSAAAAAFPVVYSDARWVVHDVRR